jgi:hypothetical protein
LVIASLPTRKLQEALGNMCRKAILLMAGLITVAALGTSGITTYSSGFCLTGSSGRKFLAHYFTQTEQQGI